MRLPVRRVALLASLLVAGLAGTPRAVDRCVEFQVSDPSVGSGSGAAVAAAPAGGFLVVWHGRDDKGSPSVQARAFDAAGDPLAGPGRVDVVDGAAFGVAAAGNADGRFLVAWSGLGEGDDDAGIQARLLAASGAPLGVPVLVNTYTTGLQQAPAVAADAAGGFVVAWTSEGSADGDVDEASIQARRIDDAGQPVGEQFQVNVATTGRQHSPDVSGEAAGSFVVTWGEDLYVDGQYRSGVRARRFDASGEGGPEMVVGELPTGAPQYTASTGDGVGGVVVLWTGPAGLEAVRYDAAGSRDGDPITVETCATCFHRGVDVSGDGAGGFLAVWEGMGTLGGVTGQGWDVHGRVFDAADVAAPEFKVNDERVDMQYGPAVARDGDGFVVVWTRDGLAPSPIEGRRLDERGCVTSTTTSTTTTTLPTVGLMPGRLILREARGRRPARARVELRGADVAADDVATSDGRLRIVSLAGAFDLEAMLPADGWRRRRRGLRHRGAEDRVRIRRRGRVDAKLVGLDLALPVTEPTPILVVLEVGGQRLCAEFTTATLDVRRRRLVARGEGAETACLEPAPVGRIAAADDDGPGLGPRP